MSDNKDPNRPLHTEPKRQLVTTNVNLGTNRSGNKTRTGFMDMDKQVYLAPKSSKRESAWKKKMEDKGFQF